jgi:hypothetical protein
MGRPYYKHGRKENFIQNYSWNTPEEQSLGRPRLKWKDNIKTGVKEHNVSLIGSEVIQQRSFNCSVK